MIKSILKNVFVFMLVSVVSYADESNIFNISDEKVNQLMLESAGAEGLKPRISKHKYMGSNNWTGPDEVLQWSMKTSSEGTCEATALVNVPAKTHLILSSSIDEVELITDMNGWQKVAGNLKLSKGEGIIKLKLKNALPKGKAGFYSLEVVTEKHLPIYKKRLKELSSSTEDAAWFQNAGYGIMFQWGYWGYPRTGETRKPWKKVYEEFDIEAFANKMQELDPGYVIWSVTWHGSRFATPLDSMEKIMGSDDFTMKYDFIGKLVDALNKRGIPVMFYYHPGHEEKEYWKKVWIDRQDRQKYADANLAIWSEIGRRLGPKLAGWFIDGTSVIHYPTDFYAYTKALKVGNPQRLVAYNPWIFPPSTAYQDVTMGEAAVHGSIEYGRLTSGREKGLMPHRMLVMDGPDWGVWKPNTVIHSPKGNLASWQTKVDDAKRNQSPVSLCILMYEDGTLSEKTETILKQLKRNN